MTATEIRRRPAGEPAPDLTDHRVLHRAIAVDLDRLTAAAAALVDRPDPVRQAALRRYLRAVSAEIESHHHVEGEHVWPFLRELARGRAALVPRGADHDRLAPLLARAAALAAGSRATPELVAVLRELTELLVRHVADEERDVFPLLDELVRPADYRRLQLRFRANLRLSLMPFVLPWVVRHATAQERPALLAHLGWPVRVLLRVVEPGYRAREELVFG